MVPILAAAAIAAAAPQATASSAVAEARATVRIVSAVRLHLGSESSAKDLPEMRQATVTTSDGPKPARLIEFE